MRLTPTRAPEALIARAISQVTCVRRCVRFLEQHRAMTDLGSALDGQQLPTGILIRMPDLALFSVALRRLASPQKWSGRWESKIPLSRTESTRIIELQPCRKAARNYWAKNRATRANAGQCGFIDRVSRLILAPRVAAQLYAKA